MQLVTMMQSGDAAGRGSTARGREHLAAAISRQCRTPSYTSYTETRQVPQTPLVVAPIIRSGASSLTIVQKKHVGYGGCSLGSPPPEVDGQRNERDEQEKVNQATRDMEDHPPEDPYDK